jgi:hypothetical protein
MPKLPLKRSFGFFRSPLADSFLSRFDKLFSTFPIPPVNLMNESTNLVYPDDIARKNQRIGHRMPVRIIFGGYEFNGCTREVSAYGATVEIGHAEFETLQNLPELPTVTVQTDMVVAEAICNGLSNNNNNFLVGIKLSDGFTWYGKN